ncbi:MAG: peptidylprolyl isomerase [Candidatus Cloacimonetes bacterium]|nr:peptidylprolyl isomerase [Candidatus Cloacimonadota bacterium]
MISVDSEKGTYQYRLASLKSIKSWNREWICTGDLIELREEPKLDSKVLIRLYPATTVSEISGAKDGFRHVRAYGKKGWVQEKSLTRSFTQEKQPNPVVEITTRKGVIKLELFEDDAPNTVANFITLVDRGFYEGLNFHRKDPGFLVQGGDPDGTGEGNPGYFISSEVQAGLKNLKGTLGMADNGMDTAGSQFYILLNDAPHLDGRYTVFGKVIDGMPIVELLEVGDEILETKIISKRDRVYLVDKLPVP